MKIEPVAITFSKFPDLERLTAALTFVLNSNGFIDGPLTVVAREPNAYASGCPSEIVACRCPDGSDLRLFCKYGADPRIEASNRPFSVEAWSDVPYEVEVYRHVLQPLQMWRPRFYGTYEEVDFGRLWLVLEYLDGILLKHKRDPDTMVLAAQWLGRFHASQETRIGSAELHFVKTLNPEYYLMWSRRTLELATDLHGGFSWLPTLCRAFENLAPSLLAKRLTITHGDYYPHNLLWRSGEIYPIDWEHLAIDLGEIDLACLTHGWNGETGRRCEIEYQKARWPEGPPGDFEQILAAGRLCLCFYNLGTHTNWTRDRQGLWYSKQLLRVGEQMGLI